jgi:endonuclease G
MAKFRSNHSGGRGTRKKGSTILRVTIFALVLFGLIVLFQRWQARLHPSPVSDRQLSPLDLHDDRAFYLPLHGKGELIQHEYFALSYREDHEQAEWVAYVLTRERLQKEWVPRAGEFQIDKKVTTGSALPEDYRGSGYERGHLAPAADLAFETSAMESSFLMSNVSPQAHDFNQGVWKELESQTRAWARRFKKLYVVTGPILSQPVKTRLGENQVSVPSAFYKALLDASEPELKGIAFILPNEISYEPLHDFVVSIDELEALTGFDLFPELLTENLEREVEAEVNIDLWPFSKEKFELRINKWNKE